MERDIDWNVNQKRLNLLGPPFDLVASLSLEHRCCRSGKVWVTVTWVPPSQAHLNEEQVRPALSRQSSSTHPWHQAMEHAAVPVLMRSRWTWAIRDDITLRCTHTLGSCYIGGKEKKKTAEFRWQIRKDKCLKTTQFLEQFKEKSIGNTFIVINTCWQF